MTQTRPENKGNEAQGFVVREMLENPTPSVPSDSTAASTVVKRYTPPNQRNRSLSRRKSGDRAVNHYANDTEKNKPYAGGNNLVTQNSCSALIALEGCSRSDASQLLHDRWAAIMHRYNDTSIDLSERPVMYDGGTELAWGQVRLPHQFMAPANNAGLTDFASELRSAMRNAKADFKS